MGTEARIQQMETEKLGYLLCKKVRRSRKSGRARRKTHRELRGRTRRAGGKGHGDPTVIIERDHLSD